MANHVTSRVDIQCNEAAQVLVEQWITTVDAMSDEDHKMVWNLMENVPDDVTYEWTTVNIGTKWCYVEEIYDNTLVLVSAWDFPIKFTDWVSQQILAIDEDATITVTYDIAFEYLTKAKSHDSLESKTASFYYIEAAHHFLRACRHISLHLQDGGRRFRSGCE